MSNYTIYHNPRCSKSRKTLEILNENGVEAKIKEYLNEALSVAELQKLSSQLGMSAREFMRTKEEVLEDLDLDLDDDNACFEAIVKNPILLERPIVVSSDDRAVLGRPPENVLELIS